MHAPLLEVGRSLQLQRCWWLLSSFGTFCLLCLLGLREPQRSRRLSEQSRQLSPAADPGVLLKGDERVSGATSVSVEPYLMRQNPSTMLHKQLGKLQRTLLLLNNQQLAGTRNRDAGKETAEGLGEHLGAAWRSGRTRTLKRHLGQKVKAAICAVAAQYPVTDTHRTLHVWQLGLGIQGCMLAGEADDQIQARHQVCLLATLR